MNFGKLLASCLISYGVIGGSVQGMENKQNLSQSRDKLIQEFKNLNNDLRKLYNKLYESCRLSLMMGIRFGTESGNTWIHGEGVSPASDALFFIQVLDNFQNFQTCVANLNMTQQQKDNLNKTISIIKFFIDSCNKQMANYIWVGENINKPNQIIKVLDELKLLLERNLPK